MNEIITVCAGVMGVVVITAAVRRIAPDWAMLCGVCLGLFILRRALNIMYPVVLYVQELLGSSQYSAYLECALKALGIATVTNITCETCRDLGDGSAAAKVELCGKAAILLCAIPVIKQIFTYVNSFLQ